MYAALMAMSSLSESMTPSLVNSSSQAMFLPTDAQQLLQQRDSGKSISISLTIGYVSVAGDSMYAGQA